MAQQRDGYQNFMPNQPYNMSSPNQPPQQVLPQGQPAQPNALNMQQPSQSFGSAPNVDPNFYYQQQQQQQQLLQQQQRQAASPQQIQQQHLNYLRAQQQQQQQQQQMGLNNVNGAGFNNFHPNRPQQQPSPQQQVSPMLMNAAAMGNRQPNPNMMYNPMMNPQMQQQRSPQQPHQQQHMRGPPQQQQIPPGYGQPPRHNGFPPHQQLPQQQLNPQQQQQLNPQQLAYQQQLLQRQQMQHQMMMQQHQQQQHGGFDPRMHQLHPHQQQQLMMQRMHPQQIQMQHHQYQQQLQAEQNRAKRPSRNATKKKRVYDMSSEEEEEEFDLESEESEASVDSEFDDSDEGRQSKKTKAAAAAAEPEEPVMIPMGTKVFERILDYRVNEESGEKQLLIKYKNTSFLHVEWVPLKQIESEHLGKHRVKKFLQKYHQDGDKGEDFKDYLKMDRVIDDGELEDPATGESRVYYLVKWNNSFYDASTWETEEDVRLHDNNLLEQFLSRKLIPQDKQGPSPPRPDVSNFTHYSESPKYKYDNTLRAYQLEGLNWLRFCYYTFRSCILADEMGLGKTVQSVALLNDIYNNLRIRGPFLIIAPLSTIPHWTRAFDAWTDLNVIDFRGSTMARNLIVETEFHYQDAEGNSIPNKFKFDVLITTYEMASAGAMTLKDIPWRCGVFDEAHRLKNKNSKVLEILRTFYMDHKLLLTGTPLQNNLGELYSLLQFMQPDIYNDEAYFFQEYGSLKTAQEVEKLQALLQPIMLRRFKEDVEKTIPVKEETVIEVELTNPQKKWYRAILEKNFSFLKKGGKSNKEMPHLRNIMMQLRKCCIHPYLLEGAEDVIVSECNATGQQEQFNCLVQSSGKLVLIDKLLRKLIQGNHKVLIFSQFTSCLDILADYLRGRSYAYERIDGSVPGDQRQAAIDRFSTLPIEESFVFLLCTRAGGVGINLTAADTCIIFDSDWNPQNDLQAQARCHRIGQTKPVQIYRLICANTYEKDMFDRAGMKLGLDKAVMGTHDDGNANKTAELNRKEIEDLLKKGAYGAMLDDEASAKFCEEDIDQILERRTTVIKHEGNEKGSVFSKATFSAAEEGDTTGVDLDDPDFWEKWAAKAHIDTTELPDENTLIVSMPRRRRQVQRFGSRTGDGSYSSNDNADDSDAAYEEEEVEPVGRGRRGRSDQVRPWTLSEKTKYERKLMIYGYGSWDLMVAHFPRRTEKDLKAVTRALMRKVLPVLENVKKVTEEDRKLIEDIKNILVNDARDEVKKNENIPYIGANKKQIAEFKSFLIQAPADYIDHVERKGRNFLLRIQMLHLIRDKIVPEDWEEAKALEMPRVTGLPPAPWWGEKEDRCLLLGICKHGYQQYLAMRNDPEFAFYGRKYDDSHSGVLEDEDAAPDYNRQPSDEPAPIIAKKTVNKRDDDSDYEDNNDKDYSDDEDKALIWPSKADIGMRLRRIIAAFLRERANDNRKRKLEEKAEQKETDRQTRQRQKESRAAVRKNEVHTRWTKRNKMDFIKTLISFGVEREDDEFNWTRFKEVANLGKKSDNALNQRYKETYAACEDAVKRYISEGGVISTSAGTDETPASSPRDMASREGSPEFDDNAKDDGLISYDKARRCLKRIKLMNTLREEVLTHPDLDAILANFKKTPGLPEWWEVPKFDKALIEGVCKHGINRSDLLAKDATLPFYHAKQDFAEGDQEGSESKFVWPKDVVVIRRVESICEAVLNPKPPKSSARGYVKKRNRSAAADAAGVSDEESRKKTRTEGDDEELSDEEMDEDENEESAYADEEDEGNMSLPAANDISVIPFEAPIETTEPVSSVANDNEQQASVQNTPLEPVHVSPTAVEEPSQNVLPIAEETVMAPPSPHQEPQQVLPAENNTVEAPMETESYTAAYNDTSLPQHEALVEQPVVDNQDQSMREPVKDDDHVMES